jgi:hypothetical protein
VLRNASPTRPIYVLARCSLSLIDIQRLSQSMYGEKEWDCAGAKSFDFSEPFLDFYLKPGFASPCGEFPDECERRNS